MNSFCFALIIQEFNVESFLGNVSVLAPVAPGSSTSFFALSKMTEERSHDGHIEDSPQQKI